jgi:hypothetical protein
MANAKISKKAELEEIQGKRLQFLELLAVNPNYFGTLTGSEFQPVLEISNDTFYEQVTCLGFNPATNVLEAVVQVKQATGYDGSLCQNGSYEYVRFFLDYGSGWLDVGLAAINVHDIPAATDCAKDPEKPLSYAVSVELTPQSNWCFFPVLPQVRAILSWNAIPTPGNPAYIPVWGNVLNAQIQIHPRSLFLSEIAASISEDVKAVLSPSELEPVLKLPVPLPDPAPLTLAQLAKLYSANKTGAANAKAAVSVPSHRFGFTQIVAAVEGHAANPQAIVANIAEWNNLNLNWVNAVENLGDVDANVSYEQLECLGLDGAYGFEKLVATFVIKQPNGYNGGLCTAGSTEYIAFWADWDDTCAYTYLGTVGVNVHDIPSIPAAGLVYNAVLPVNLSQHRSPCETPKIARMRAVLSWAVPPSTTDPDALTYWGNMLSTHVQIQPGIPGNPLEPTISILGGIPTSMIDGTGLTTSSAVFALTNTPADAYGRACPFGGVVSIQGESFVGYKYQLTVQDLTSGGLPITLNQPLTLTRWDGTTYTSAPDSSGYYTYVDPSYNQDQLLGEWDTTGNDLWLVTLQIAQPSDAPVSGASSDTHVIQLNNSVPQAQINLDNNLDCSQFNVGATLTGHFVAWATYFGSYSIGTEPYAGPVSPSSGITPTTPLPSSGSPWTLNTAGMTPCGYTIQVDVSDRTIVDSSPGVHNFNDDYAGFCLLT